MTIDTAFPPSAIHPWVKIGTSRRRDELMREALIHWWEGDPAAARRSLGIAAALEPSNHSVALAIAYTHVLDGDLARAVTIYGDVLQQDPTLTDVRATRAFYNALRRQPSLADADWMDLHSRDSTAATYWRNVFSLADSASTKALVTEPPAIIGADRHAFVVLGYALREDGTPDNELLDRLAIAVNCLDSDKNAQVIVSGGQRRNNITEAAAMTTFLTTAGVAHSRILVESDSEDTIENVLFTLAMAEKRGIKLLTVITGAEHMRRALALFDVGNLVREVNGLKRIRMIGHVAAAAEPQRIEPSDTETVSIFRDALRMAGAWAFPGIQR